MLERSKQLTAEFVRLEVEKELDGINLEEPKSGAQLETFIRSIKHLSLGPSILNIKLWNRNQEVVWSRNNALIGERFPGNEELKKALEDRVVSDLNTLEKYKGTESRPTRMLELYIPVRRDSRGNVSAVLEVYQDLASLDSDIAHHKRIILFAVTGCFGSVFILLSGIVGAASKKINRQAKEIRESYEFVSAARDEWEETFNTIQDAITIHDKEFNVLRANKAAEEILGLPLIRIKRQKCYESYHAADCPPEGCPSCNVLKTGAPVTLEYFEPHLNRYLEIRAIPRFGENGEIIGIVHVSRDITKLKEREKERHQLQQQLLQSQKMESFGRLAGGIAHDFNNLLTGILGYSDLLLTELPEESSAREKVEIIACSGEKAGALTRQLLAFSRKQVLEFRVISLNTIVEHMYRILQRTIGEDISLKLSMSRAAVNIKADPGQIEQILMNLAVNARDAMKSGGQLLIETSRVNIAEGRHAGTEELLPGPYVMLAVTDSGEGIPEEIQDEIFEPFFTTKAKGKGTGLGLSTVFGIIKQHNGHILVESESGKGTVFKVYLPACEETPTQKRQVQRGPGLMNGSERVLVVEDDATIRRMVRDSLGKFGYSVKAVVSGEEALRMVEGGSFRPDLLLTDVIMTGISGGKLAERLKNVLPELSVIFMSGYAGSELAKHGVFSNGQNFLQKPLKISTLARKLREVFDRKSEAVENLS